VLGLCFFVSTLGLGPLSGVTIGRLSGVGALWDCVSRVWWSCAGGGVPLGAVLMLSWCGEVSLWDILIIFWPLVTNRGGGRADLSSLRSRLCYPTPPLM